MAKSIFGSTCGLCSHDNDFEVSYGPRAIFSKFHLDTQAMCTKSHLYPQVMFSQFDLYPQVFCLTPNTQRIISSSEIAQKMCHLSLTLIRSALSENQKWWSKTKLVGCPGFANQGVSPVELRRGEWWQLNLIHAPRVRCQRLPT